MNENVTRIADLPDNFNTMSSQQNDLGLQNSYIPINIHPKPFGNSSQMQNLSSSTPPRIQESGSNNMQLTDEQKMMIDNTPNKKLPSRDIRIEPIQILQDEQTQINYIPPDDLSNDFVLEYEMNKDKKLKSHEQNKHRTRLIDRIFTEIQTPLLIAILFFIFQMPVINKYLFKYFIFLNVYNQDGNLNIYGMLVKSVFFGLLYYLMVMSSEYISEL